EPKTQRTDQHLLVTIRWQVPLKLGRRDPSQHTGYEWAFFDGVRGLGRRNDLAALPAAGTGICVSHVLDDVGLSLFQFELLGDMRSDHDARLSAAAAGQLF